jgi:hypothetical protein
MAMAMDIIITITTALGIMFLITILTLIICQGLSMSIQIPPPLIC